MLESVCLCVCVCVCVCVWVCVGVYGCAYKVSELSEVLRDIGNNLLERSTLECFFL